MFFNFTCFHLGNRLTQALSIFRARHQIGCLKTPAAAVTEEKEDDHTDIVDSGAGALSVSGGSPGERVREVDAVKDEADEAQEQEALTPRAHARSLHG